MLNPKSKESIERCFFSFSTNWACGEAEAKDNTSHAEFDVTGESTFYASRNSLYVNTLRIQANEANSGDTNFETRTIELNANSSYNVTQTIAAGYSKEANVENTSNASVMDYFTVQDTKEGVNINYVPTSTVTKDSTTTITITTTPLENTVTYFQNTSLEDKTFIIDENHKVTLNDNYTTFSLAEAGFVNEGYQFKEWNTQADGKGTSYIEVESLTNITANMDLYAIWEKNQTPIIIIPGDNTGDTTGGDPGDPTGGDPGDTTGGDPGDTTGGDPGDTTGGDTGDTTDGDIDDTTDIDDGDTPLAPEPGDTDNNNNNEGIIIDTDKTPLAGDVNETNLSSDKTAPKTGDAGALPWLILSGAAGLGLATIVIRSKKRS